MPLGCLWFLRGPTQRQVPGGEVRTAALYFIWGPTANPKEFSSQMGDWVHC